VNADVCRNQGVYYKELELVGSAIVYKLNAFQHFCEYSMASQITEKQSEIRSPLSNYHLLLIPSTSTTLKMNSAIMNPAYYLDSEPIPTKPKSTIPKKNQTPPASSRTSLETISTLGKSKAKGEQYREVLYIKLTIMKMNQTAA
jgi:hypothetical protein